MPPRLSFRLLAVLAFLTSVLAPGAGIGRVPKRPVAVATPPAAVSDLCQALPGEAPDIAPRLRSSVELNYTNDMLEQPSDGVAVICMLIDSTGTVRETGLGGPATPFDRAALEAARWWVFDPARRDGRAVAVRIKVRIEASVPRDADLLVPDVVALARDAESRGNVREALDAWTGALTRVGRHPALQNEWVLREHIVRLAARLPKPPEVPMLTEAKARGQHQLMLRNVARASNADYAHALDEVLRVAPWYADAYRWRASARAASGQRDGAVRDVLCYRFAVRDSAGLALAQRALIALANADTIAAMTMLKN